jgi:hypothetical protein
MSQLLRCMSPLVAQSDIPHRVSNFRFWGNSGHCGGAASREEAVKDRGE